MDTNTFYKELIFTTVKINTVTYDNKQKSGTGFFFHYQYEGQNFEFVVTNKHVIEDADLGEFTVTKGANKPELGNKKTFNFDKFNNLWFSHPDPKIDVSVLDLRKFIKSQQEYDELFIRTISNKNIPNDSELSSFDAVEDILFVGYPNGLWDGVNNIPIVRKGITATPIEVDYEGMPVFLIDASVFAGSSGSPTIIFDHGLHMDLNNNVTTRSRFNFLGIVSAVCEKDTMSPIIQKVFHELPDIFAKGKREIDIGLVYKAKTVIETIQAYFKL